ncbi:MAG: glycerophosphodiester phosphodiesterase family protein [Myxococcaceae bacterium]|nr:glycerophosphodiester phosphodiesterase family protein [Myxococcaceae bacterium]
MRRILLSLLLLAACAPPSPKVTTTRVTPTQCLHDASCAFLLFAAHRGVCGDDTEPENSLASYLACAKAGAPMVEVDIRVTKDGKVVLHHDSDVLRVTDFEARYGATRSAKVEDLTLAEFQSLRFKDPRCQGAEVDLRRCQGATLDELLDATADTGLTFFIDYKSGDLAHFIADVKAKPGAAERMLFFDANLPTLQRVHAELPTMELMPRVQSAAEARTLLASTTLPIRWIHGDPDYVKALAPELNAKGVRLYANVWLLDAEFIAVITGTEADKDAAWTKRVKPQLETLIRDGLAGAGSEWSARMIRGLYPDGWGVTVTTVLPR